MKIVTGCERKYLPGVKALMNSVQRNVPDGELEMWCLTYGDDGVRDAAAEMGYNVIHNATFPKGTQFPVGGMWKGREADMPVMYCRIKIPSIFPHEKRVMWLDADTLVMQSIAELETFDMNGKCTAQPLARKGFRWAPQNKNVDAYNSGVMLFDVQEWLKQDCYNRMLALMNDSPIDEPGGVVETLLNFMFMGEVARLPDIYHFNAKRMVPQRDAKILHFPCCMPWDEQDMAGKPGVYQEAIKKYWKPYA